LKNPDVREIRVPCGVEDAVEEIIDLVLVGVVVARLEIEALVREPGGELMPDLLDLGVVDHGT
jgi:hypothetical protein